MAGHTVACSMQMKRTVSYEENKASKIGVWAPSEENEVRQRTSGDPRTPIRQQPTFECSPAPAHHRVTHLPGRHVSLASANASYLHVWSYRLKAGKIAYGRHPIL
jgi:hypothetical protein